MMGYMQTPSLGGLSYISLSSGWFWIKCHLLIEMFLRFAKAGWYVGNERQNVFSHFIVLLQGRLPFSNLTSEFVFAPHCSFASTDSVDVEELIKGYFHRGYPYNAIVGLLGNKMGCECMSELWKGSLRIWVWKEEVVFSTAFSSNPSAPILSLTVMGSVIPLFAIRPPSLSVS